MFFVCFLSFFFPFLKSFSFFVFSLLFLKFTDLFQIFKLMDFRLGLEEQVLTSPLQIIGIFPQGSGSEGPLSCQTT